MSEKTENNFELCPIRNILDRFGDKWSLLVLTTLEKEGRMRFSVIHKKICDISQKMLTVTLRSLEADGLISREVFPEIPPRVEYELTPLGKSLLPYVDQLILWGKTNFPEIIKSRELFARRQSVMSQNHSS